MLYKGWIAKGYDGGVGLVAAVQDQKQLYSTLRNVDNECRYSALKERLLCAAAPTPRLLFGVRRTGQGPALETADRLMLTNQST